MPHLLPRLLTLAFIPVLLLATTIVRAGALDPLDAYIDHLKQDHAGPRQETGFLSAGSDFLYGQESLESGNAASAASYFRGALQKDDGYAFAHFQLAVALLRQNDAALREEAERQLQRAVELDPRLKPRRDSLVVEKLAAPAATTSGEAAEAPATAPAAAGARSLRQYLHRLKASYAARGPDTAMNSAGQAVLYGLEYYDAGDLAAAETDFRRALGREPSNPYANFLLAVSVAAQGRDADAAPFLATAVAADASLQQDYPSAVAAAKARWQKKQQARLIPVSPPATVVYGGPLVFGKYACSETIWNGPNTSPAFRTEYRGYFDLKPDGTYRWLDNGETGRYAYDAVSGRLTWLSGRFQDLPETTLYHRSGANGLITINFSESYRWSCLCEAK